MCSTPIFVGEGGPLSDNTWFGLVFWGFEPLVLVEGNRETPEPPNHQSKAAIWGKLDLVHQLALLSHGQPGQCRTFWPLVLGRSVPRAHASICIVHTGYWFHMCRICVHAYSETTSFLMGIHMNMLVDVYVHLYVRLSGKVDHGGRV